MDRRQRHLIVIGVAVLTAALASSGVYLAIKRIPVREVEVAQQFVVVAVRSLPTGVRVTARDVRLAPWPSSSMVAGGFSSVDAVVNRGLLASVVENEPLVESKLARPNAGAGLPPAIPPGMRAMSVKVNDVIGVAGFIDPGTRVDLVVTIRKRDESTSRTVVSNVEVLTAGSRSDQQKVKDGKPAVAAAVVTLLVKPDEAERIALAQAEGQIMLALRNPLDTESTASVGVRTAALLGEAIAAPPAKAPAVAKKPAVVAAAVTVPPPAPAPRIYTVEAIRAAKRTEEVVH
jgi:pilus assembly protein CpaB